MSPRQESNFQEAGDSPRDARDVHRGSDRGESMPEEALKKPSPSDDPSLRGRRRSRKSREGRACFRARASLIALFFVLRAVDFYVYTQTPRSTQTALLVIILNNTLWSTMLIAAIWFRKAWARYLLIFLRALGLLAILMLLPDLSFHLGAGNRMLTVLCIRALVDFAAVIFLLFSADLNRLTGRAFR